MENLPTVIGSFLGGGTIVGAFVFWYLKRTVTRRDSKRDKADEKAEQKQTADIERADANRGKEIDADSEAFKIIANRLHEVEERFDAKIEKLQAELANHMVAGAKKDAKIEHLEKDNDRLRERVLSQDKLIDGLRRELDILKLQVSGKNDIGSADNPVHAVIEST
jgi:predicted RNase H-like nuclease (RuvC/YqgF family)